MLLEAFVMSGALVFAMRRSVFEDKLRRVLFYSGIGAVAAVVGACVRGRPADALVLAPLAFALMAGAIVLLDSIVKGSNRS